MKILTDEMVNNRQKIENKIRKEIAEKIHKNLASQYRYFNFLNGCLKLRFCTFKILTSRYLKIFVSTPT